LKVLLVDDEPGFLEQAKIFLKRKEDFNIETSTSADTALNLFEKLDFDAIVSDYKMPRRDGLELLEIVRSEKDSDIPFIIFTGHSREKVAREALNLGANRYLQKGGNPKTQYSVLADAIVQEVESWLRKKDLEKSKEETQLLLDNFPAMVFITDKDGEIIKVNQTLADFLGVPKIEIEGKHLEEIFPEEQAKKMNRDNQEVIESGESKLDIIEPYQTENGTRWRKTDKLPKESDAGKVKGVIGFARDITERKKAEEREEFLHSLLRHELFNNLEIVWGYVELLLERDISEAEREYVEKMENMIEESIDLIEKVKTLRDVEGEKKADKVDLNPILRDALDKQRDQLSEADISVKLETSEVMVWGGSLLEELISNLVENSVRHSGGDLIRVRTLEMDENCLLIVEDDGEGIPDDCKNDIFQRGYRKGENAGSGLGMYLIKEIAEIYGADVEVKDSELGGVRVDVCLKKI